MVAEVEVSSQSHQGLNDGDVQVPKRKKTLGLKIFIGILSFLGIVVLSTSLAGKPIVNLLVTSQVHDVIRLDDTATDTFKLWSNPSSQGVDVYMNIVMWNLTNPDEVLQGAKPQVKMIGPFSYREENLKHSFVYNDDKSIIRYKINRTWHFVNKTCPPDTKPDDFSTHCSIPEDTLITTMNVPLMGVIDKLDPLKKAEEFVLNEINKSCSEPDSETIVIRRPIQDLVFGYNDSLIYYLQTLIEELDLTIYVPDYKILENNSFAGRTMYSAVYTRSADGNVGQFDEWYGNQQSMNIWNGCDESGMGGNQGRLYNYLGNLLNGTEGFFFQPGVETTTKLNALTPDLSRSSGLVYNNSVTFQDVTLYRFIIDPESLANVTTVPQNCAFSSFGGKGTLNMSSFLGGVPIFASKPFFLDADPSYSENVTIIDFHGDTTDRSKYDSYLDIEPITGALFRANKALQTQLQVHPHEYVDKVAKVRPFFMPITINYEMVEVPTNITDEFKHRVQDPLDLASYYEEIGPYAGAFFLALSLVLVFFLRKRTIANKTLRSGETQQLIRKKPYY